jgi:ketosteroid isomerase-like protein
MRNFLAFKTAYGVLALWAICGGAIAQQGYSARGDEATIRECEAKWDTAAVNSDVKAFDQLLADQYIATDPEGRIQTKSQLLADLKSGNLKFLISEADEMKIFLYGDAAVVSGRWKGKYIENGKTYDTVERYTSTYARQNGQWRSTSSHGSKIQSAGSK